MEPKFTPVPTSDDHQPQPQYDGGFPPPGGQPMGNPYYNQGPGHGQPIEMQPMLGNPHGYAHGPPPGPAGPGYGYQQPPSALVNLGFLNPLFEVFLDDDGDDLLVVNEAGDFILKVDKQYLAPRQRSGIGGAQTGFLTQSGQTMFACSREEFSAAVSAGDFALGDVEGDCCGCDRSFEIRSKTGGPKFDLIPTGALAGVGRSFCNACCMTEYLISSGGNTVGSITCAGGGRGSRHKIQFQTGLDVKSKALILAASVVIYDLYFSTCCGNVGNMGSRYICGCGIIGITLLIFAILVIYILVRGDTSKNDNEY